MHFNLLEDGFIPVLRTNGRFDRVGIRAALTEAGRIRQIAASNPVDNVVLLRLLVAVLEWCKPKLSPGERTRLDAATGIPEEWLLNKLGTRDQPNQVFELLANGGGFYQDGSLRNAKAVAATNLLHDLPSGSKLAHFRHVRDDRAGLCLACSAVGLARWPAVASAGTAGAGESMTASINGNTPAYSVELGHNLLATLLLTWPIASGGGDSPTWDNGTEQSALGPLKGLTWRSRRVVLAPRDDAGRRDLATGRCCYCGEHTIALVRSILFRPGWARPSKGPWEDDPHLCWLRREPKSKAKATKIVPSWPSPNDALEKHAEMWCEVLKALFQRPLDSPARPARYYTILLASSQALYKHVEARTDALPGLDVGAIAVLSKELDWLQRLMWTTTAGRTGKNWHDPPKGHRIVTALRASGAQGYAVRSALCARSSSAGCYLERAFMTLMRELARAGSAESATQEAIGQWRNDASGILGTQIAEVVALSTTGSPLRRREALVRARSALRGALQLAATEGRGRSDGECVTRTPAPPRPEGGG